MDYTSQWPDHHHQGIISGIIANKPVLEGLPSPSPSSKEATDQKKAAKAAQRVGAGQPQEGSSSCPRCNSTNTKFCYYNNYSLSQPRYFCKTCRRYWTQGGSLRNVPVGGGSRKNTKRSSSKKIAEDPSGRVGGLVFQSNPPNPNTVSTHDLNLAYDIPGSGLPVMLPGNPSFVSSGLSLGNFMALGVSHPSSADPVGNNIYSSTMGSGLFGSLQDQLKPTLHYFSLDNPTNNAHDGGFRGGVIGGNDNISAREDARGGAAASNGDGDDDDDGLIYEHNANSSGGQGDHHHSTPGGYNWNSGAMFGGGSWQL